MYSAKGQMPVLRLRKKELAEHGFGGSWEARLEASALRQSHKLGIFHSTQKHQPHTPSESSLSHVMPLPTSPPLSRPS